MGGAYAESPTSPRSRKATATVSTETVPRTVRVAGVLTTLQATAGFVFVIALLIRSTSAVGGVGEFGPTQTYGEAGYFTLLSAGVLAAGIGMLKGKHWARTPALLLQLILLGIAWYATGPSVSRSSAWRSPSRRSPCCGSCSTARGGGGRTTATTRPTPTARAELRR